MRYRNGECFLVTRKIVLCEDRSLLSRVIKYIQVKRMREQVIIIHNDLYIDFKDTYNSVVILNEEIVSIECVKKMIEELSDIHKDHGIDIIIISDEEVNFSLRKMANYIISTKITSEMFYIDRKDGCGRRILVKMGEFITSEN